MFTLEVFSTEDAEDVHLRDSHQNDGLDVTETDVSCEEDAEEDEERKERNLLQEKKTPGTATGETSAAGATGAASGAKSLTQERD